MDNFLGISLDALARIPLKSHELGYKRPGISLDHYFLNIDAPLTTYNNTKPMAIVNLGTDIVLYVDQRWFDNVETVQNAPPGYQKVIVSWFDTPTDMENTYDN